MFIFKCYFLWRTHILDQLSNYYAGKCGLLLHINYFATTIAAIQVFLLINVVCINMRTLYFVMFTDTMVEDKI